jgi:DNA-binding transcriptional regulator YiaG
MENVNPNIDRIRNLYCLIENGALPDSKILTRTLIVEQLENAVGLEFKDTADFHEKVDAFLRRGGRPGDQLLAARKERHWSQRTLGSHLGVSCQFVKEMEKGRKSLSDKALVFIREQGL